MSVTTIGTSDTITVEQFNDIAFREYVDKTVLKPYMGMNSESVIQVKEDLLKSKGDALTYNLATALDGAGVEDNGTMEGNEEQMLFYGHRVALKQFKNAVLDDGSMTRRRSPFELRAEFMPALTTWMAQKLENKLFEALGSASTDGLSAYGGLAEATKDAWVAANSDRILFGAAVSNNSANDHSSSLANVDGTNDILKTETVTLAKRIAQLANPKIRPIKIENGEEYYVMFVHPYAARDLKNTDAWKNAQQYAMVRGLDNPIFTGMLGMWDGVILKESPKCLLLDNVGASSIDVSANFLCGAQALLLAQGGYPEQAGARVVMTEKLFDYDEKQGLQIKSTWGHAKATFNSKQHGVVTVYTAAVAD